ncbi:MAG TPA: dipeptide ABC transporter ATP-binding protein [Rhodocyclaceae bacterium]|nr:dipeptide ABC transporter ATP-binding protein [Rhodocyclaceae bacterium]
MKLLEIDGLVTELSDGRDWLRAVAGVSLAVRRGETYCLVGESGSGKSVTALSVMGLLPEARHRHPAGHVRLYDGGEDAALELLGADEARLQRVRGGRIGMIFQEPMTSLNPVMTIGEQLDEALQLHHPELSPAMRAERIVAALAEVRMPEPASRVREYPHRLSGGQRQRVMIAMALICEPALLIADEPTTALDVTVQAEILKLMRELQQRRGMGMLFITHDFGVVAQIADRVGVMRRGELVESGPARELLHRPQHEYTRSLIAALPERLERPTRPHIDRKPLVEVRDLAVHFPVRRGLLRRVVDHFRAVDGVSLDVHAGEVVALVGESGCGKTTLGRALLRLLEPTRGSIRLEGEDITRLPRPAMRALRRRMQVVFQDPGSSLNPRLPIVTTLTEPMRVHGVGADDDERRRRAAALLERVEMPADSLWRYPHEFSGGQRQRLAIARALVLEPRFILCDEITSALDVSVQAGILRLLRRLVDEEGLGMLFITHNMGVVEFLADRMAVMHAGKIVESGRTDEVLHAPQDEYTRSLLAAVPRLDGALVAG